MDSGSSTIKNNQSYLKLCNLFLQNKDNNTSVQLPLTQALINLKEQQDLADTQVIYFCQTIDVMETYFSRCELSSTTCTVANMGKYV